MAREMSERDARTVRAKEEKMAKPAGRFTRRVEFWTTEAQANAIDGLNDGGLLGKADHLRLMADLYLQHRNAVAPRPAMNAQHPAE
jgi:hypothetical protein